MAFNGYLLKIGDFKITGVGLIKYESYDVTREVQDMDSYRDAVGVLHRNALGHVPIKVNMETLDNLTNVEVNELFTNIARNYTNALERKANVEVYVPETDEYITQEMYIAGPTLKIRSIDLEDNLIHYTSFKLTLIGY